MADSLLDEAERESKSFANSLGYRNNIIKWEYKTILNMPLNYML